MNLSTNASKSVTTVWVLGDQLSTSNSALAGLTPDKCVVLMIESLSLARRRPYHKQKLVLVWSAMRHRAADLRARGYAVDYYAAQLATLPALRAHLATYQPARLRVMDTAEHGRAERLAALVRGLGYPAEVTPNNAFVVERAWFDDYARRRRVVRLEQFYRQVRRQTGLLMDGDRPVGGKWSYDRLNRQPLPPGLAAPPPPHCPPDAITREVMALVRREFPHHFGEVDTFGWPVTRADAERWLEDFLDQRLDLFGPYEDAMRSGDATLFHSQLSPLLNLGLLAPLDVCQRAEDRYRRGKARLNSVEGFVRQIIGWREFVAQVYHRHMPGYLGCNELAADLPLPAFYWTAETRMRCVADAVSAVRRRGINHHIQRLMITGNLALLAGIDPQAVNEWYWFAYVDAYEWVVTPNVLGLALYADGGLIASKPYAAAAAYIHRMSNYCAGCAYDHRRTVGEEACPFNALYWDFLARNEARLRANPRLALALAALRRRDAALQAATQARAAQIRQALRSGTPL
ncbi:MAG: cryptochrome/photolyase family protein [Anaerolineae bacterium]